MLFSIFNFSIVSAVVFSLFFLLCCDKSYQNAQFIEQSIKVGFRGVLHKNKGEFKEQNRPCKEEIERKETAERMDKQNLLYTAKVVTDSDKKMLQPPEHTKKYFGKEFTIASTPPDVDFAVVPVKPKFLTLFNNQHESGWWGNYCQSNYSDTNGKFYSGVADHGAYDSHIFIVEYDPAARKVKCFPELNKAVGRTQKQFMDGILHGWLDFYQSKDLNRPHLWFCTYWSRFPEPTEEDYATGYDGGHIFSLDVTTGDYIDYGAPLLRTSWPYHRVDTKHGML